MHARDGCRREIAVIVCPIRTLSAGVANAAKESRIRDGVWLTKCPWLPIIHAPGSTRMLSLPRAFLQQVASNYGPVRAGLSLVKSSAKKPAKKFAAPVKTKADQLLSTTHKLIALSTPQLPDCGALRHRVSVITTHPVVLPFTAILYRCPECRHA